MDAGDRMILARLNQLESYLRLRLDGQSDGTYDDMAPSMNNDELGGNGTRPEINLRLEEGVFSPFELPQVKDMFSRPLHSQQLLAEELARPPFQVGDSLSLEFHDNQATVQAFFDTVNIWYACVDPASWPATYQIAALGHFREGAESCLVLLVLALGKAGSAGDFSGGQEAAGMQYFSAAWSLIPSLVISHSVIASQCIILASAYLLYLARPVEAWTLLGSITMKLKLHLTNQAALAHEAKKLSIRVIWNAILLESDILAELALPQSSLISHFSSLALPSPFGSPSNSNDDDTTTAPLFRDDPLYLTANIALYRLRMRISETLYSVTTPSSVGALEPLILDLDSSLSGWSSTYLDPSLSVAPAVRNLLGFRYHSTRALIYRPVLHLSLSSDFSPPSPPTAMATTTATTPTTNIMTNGNVHSSSAAARSLLHTSLDSSMGALEHYADYSATYFPFAWQGGLTVVRCAIAVTAARDERSQHSSSSHLHPIPRDPTKPSSPEQHQSQSPGSLLSSLLPAAEHVDAVLVAVAHALGALTRGGGGGGMDKGDSTISNATSRISANPNLSPSLARAAMVMEEILAATSTTSAASAASAAAASAEVGFR